MVNFFFMQFSFTISLHQINLKLFYYKVEEYPFNVSFELGCVVYLIVTVIAWKKRKKTEFSWFGS